MKKNKGRKFNDVNMKKNDFQERMFPNIEQCLVKTEEKKLKLAISSVILSVFGALGIASLFTYLAFHGNELADINFVAPMVKGVIGTGLLSTGIIIPAIQVQDNKKRKLIASQGVTNEAINLHEKSVINTEDESE